MNRIILVVPALAFAFAFIAPNAYAQVYKWIDKDGKVQYSDQPPTTSDTKSIPQRMTSTTSSPSASAAPAAAGPTGVPGKDKVPDKSKDFDKRRAEAAEKSKKEEEAAKTAQAKEDRCNELKGYVRNLEGGGRISKIDANGERYFLDDEQFQKETERARRDLTETCK